MKFSAATLFCVLHSTSAFVAPNQPAATKPSFVTTRFSTATSETATDDEQQQRTTKKEERLRMMKSDQFHRKGFKEVRDNVEATMQQQFQSEIVKTFRESNYLIEKDGVKVYLAKVRAYM
jgi:4-hydroxy-3-methylbut-2-enyl diphosphate reductase